MSPREYAHRVYRFGDFRVDLDRGTLYHGEREVHLRPKSFAVLRVLLENQGRLVSKAELHDVVWGKSVVTDDSLAHCVADIRRALGGKGFDIIQTVPRRGYVLDHTVVHEMADPPRPADRQRRELPLGPIAAALFAAAMLWLAAGHGGGEALDAAAGDVTRATAMAPDVEPSSTDIEAYNEYRKGRFFFKRRGAGDLDRAEASFKAAVERDPSFGAAWTGLAGVYCVRHGEDGLSLEETLPLLGDATRHALSLAPDSAEAHVRRASYHTLLGEHAVARQHIETAMMLDPDDVLVLGIAAGEFAQRSHFDEAIELQRRAIRRDPTSALLHHNLVWFLLAAGRNTEAPVEAERYRALNPAGIDDAGELFTDVQILQGNYEQALILARNMSAGPLKDRNLAIIHHALGQPAEADAALQRLLAYEDQRVGVHVAEVLVQRGNIEDAMQWLSGALRSPGRGAPRRLQLFRDTLWLLSPYLIELRRDGRWKTMYADVIDARDDAIFVARADVRESTGMR